MGLLNIESVEAMSLDLDLATTIAVQTIQARRLNLTRFPISPSATFMRLKPGIVQEMKTTMAFPSDTKESNLVVVVDCHCDLLRHQLKCMSKRLLFNFSKAFGRIMFTLGYHQMAEGRGLLRSFPSRLGGLQSAALTNLLEGKVRSGFHFESRFDR